MAFLKEGAVKDLMMRGPNKDELIQWASENVLMTTVNPDQKIREYASQFGLSVSELETLAKIFMGMEQEPSEADVLSDLLSTIEEGRQMKDIAEGFKSQNEYINKNTNMKQSILMSRLLKEDHHKECSDEASMAKIQLKSIIDGAGEILQGLDSCEELDAWVQSKISIAEDYITTVAKYMKYEEEEKPEELPLVPAAEELPAEELPAEELPPAEDGMMMGPIDAMAPIEPIGPDEEPEGDMMASDEEPEEMEFDAELSDEPEEEMDGELEDEVEEPEEEDLDFFSKGELVDL